MIKKFIVTMGFRGLTVILISIILGFSSVINIYLVQNIVDGIYGSINYSFLYLLLYFMANLLIILLKRIKDYLKICLKSSIERIYGKDIILKCERISYINYEDSEICNIIDRIMGNYVDNIMETLVIIENIITILISIIGIVSYLFMINNQTIFFVVLLVIPIYFFSIVAAKREQNAYINNYHLFHRAKYFSNIINSRHFSKESRLFDSYDFFEEKWESQIKEFQSGSIKANLKSRMIICI